MNKYEIEDTAVSVPTSWNDLTVGVYDKIWPLRPKTARARAEVIAIACGIDTKVIFEWPTEVFNMILADTQFLFKANPVPPLPHVDIDGVKYVVALEQKLSFGEYIDVDDVQKTSSAILSNVLAIVCRPAGEKYDPDNNEARAAMFAALPVSQVQGVLAFFLQFYQTSTKLMKQYADLQAMADLLPQNTGSLLRRGAFIRLSRTWQVIKFGFLMKLLRARLQKYSPLSYTNATSGLRNKRKQS